MAFYWVLLGFQKNVGEVLFTLAKDTSESIKKVNR